MKFLCLVILSLSLSVTQSFRTHPQSKKCNLCDKLVKFNTTVHNQHLQTYVNQLQDLCVDACRQNVETLPDHTIEFISMVGCEWCLKIIGETVRRSVGNDYDSIKFALGKSCQVVQYLIQKARCKLFVNFQESAIVQAITHYRKNIHNICLALQQCP